MRARPRVGADLRSRCRAMIAVPNVQETRLAWAVVEAAKPYLNDSDRYHVFVAVGAGDTFRTIRVLLKLASAKQIPLPAELVQRCTTWLDTYGLREEAQLLRRRLQVSSKPDAPANSTNVVTEGVPAAPKGIETPQFNNLVAHAMALS
jgi:hypothetical protein